MSKQALIKIFVLSLFIQPVSAAKINRPVCPLPIEPSKRPYQPAITVEADSLTREPSGTHVLAGNVNIKHQFDSITADFIRFDSSASRLSARGAVRFSDEQFEMLSQALEYDFITGKGALNDVQFTLGNGAGRGSADSVSKVSDGIIQLKNGSFTTCPIGNNGWEIGALSIDIDQQSHTGKASQAFFKFGGQKIMALPYFEFPTTSERKSGFLIPSMAASSRNGLSVAVPYYFNLAPNYDATVTSKYFVNNGFKFDTNYRYLWEGHRGSINYDLIPHDKNQDGALRYFFNADHVSQLSEHQSLTLRAEGASDVDYLDDFGGSVSDSQRRYLERSLAYTYDWDDLTGEILVQDFQSLGSAVEAFARLPQATLDWKPIQNEQQQLSMTTQFSRFSHDTKVDGNRWVFNASFNHRFKNAYAFFEPGVSFHHSRYDLSDGRELSRSVPGASIDTGLFFERSLKDGKRIQTIEPRLFLAWNRYVDQVDTPVFDSAGRSPSFSQLFETNRYIGHDRIEDSNRLSATVTSRIQDLKTGREVINFSAGQVFYFDERQVSLPDEQLDSGDRSEWVFEVSGNINRSTRLLATQFLSPDTGDTTASRFQMNYRDDKSRLLNIAHQRRQDSHESARISASAPISTHWRIATAVNQDLQRDKLVDGMVALEYEACCYKARVATRRYLLNDGETYDRAVFAEFELKDLGSFGSSVRQLLKNRIYGYE